MSLQAPITSFATRCKNRRGRARLANISIRAFLYDGDTNAEWYHMHRLRRHNDARSDMYNDVYNDENNSAVPRLLWGSACYGRAQPTYTHIDMCGADMWRVHRPWV